MPDFECYAEPPPAGRPDTIHGPIPDADGSREGGPVVVPDYELLALVGRGGYGEVWLARGVLGGLWAVKVVRQDGRHGGRPFEREFDGLKRFEPLSRSHAGLVQVLHVGRFEGGFYYVMELADPAAAEPWKGNSARLPEDRPGSEVPPLPGRPAGQSSTRYAPRTLASEIRRLERVAVRDCVELGLQLTGALGFLHENGLVHRDIKPSNIIFVTGRAKLADIGLVAASERTLSFVGTEGYVPPEGPGRPSADLFALGKVLYEAATGRDRTDFPELPTRLSQDAEQRALEELNEVILKACEPDPRHRYKGAKEMRADLDLLNRGGSVQHRRRRQRRVRLAGRTLAATAVIALAIWILNWGRPAAPIPTQTLPERLALDGAEFWRTPFSTRMFDFSSDGEHLVFVGTNGFAVWEQSTSIRRPLPLKLESGWQVAGAEGQGGSPRWDPAGRRFVFRAVRQADGTNRYPVAEHGLFLVDPRTGDVQQIGPSLPDGQHLVDLCWHPDGRHITGVFGLGRFVTLALDGKRSEWTDSGLPRSPAFRLGEYSPGGSRLLVSAQIDRRGPVDDRDIWWVPHLGGPAVRLTAQVGTDAFPTWGPGGRVVVYGSAGGRLRHATWGLWMQRLDGRTGQLEGQPLEVLVRPGERFMHPKIMADGQTLLYAVEQRETKIWLGTSPGEGEADPVVRGQQPILSSDGEWVYFAGETSDRQGIFAIHRSGEESTLRQVTSLSPLATGLTRPGMDLARDGSALALFAFDGKRRGVFVAPTVGGEVRLLEELPAWDPVLPVWSPDGAWLAYTVDTNLVRRSADGSRREVLATRPIWQGCSLRWSPDGQRLAALESVLPGVESQPCRLCLVNVADRTLKTLTSDDEPEWKEGVEWHPSGGYLTYMRYGSDPNDAQIRRAYPDGRATDLMIDQPESWDYLGVWAPNGRHYYFQTARRLGKVIDRYDAQTGIVQQGVWPGGIADLPQWSRNGRIVARTETKLHRAFERLRLQWPRP